MDQETWDRQKAASLAKAKAEGREPWQMLCFDPTPGDVIAAHGPMQDAQEEEAAATQADRDAQAAPYSAHLIYEVEALVRIAAWLQSLSDDEGPPMLWAACLEACLVHARLLIEFLVGRESGRKPKDFGAVDLLPGWDDQVRDGKLDRESLRLFLDRLDKALAHLSKDRVAEDDRPDTWALDGVNLVFRSVKVFALALTDAESQVGEPLIYALQSYEATFPVRAPT